MITLSRQNDFLRTDHLHRHLRSRAISGTFVTGASQACKIILNIASTVVFARFLNPTDFGLVAMVTALTGFLSIFKDAGLSTATVQREGITHAQVSNLFWINISLSGLIALVVAALAPAIAVFYQDPRLVGITLLLSTTFLISGASVQHQALLNRQMRFTALAFIDLGSGLASLLVGASMAILGFGYWSLIGASLTLETVGLLITLFISRWRPQRPVARSGTWALLSFGANLTTGNFIFSLARVVDSVLIGRLYGAEALGLYSRATALLLRPLDQFMVPIGAVLLPSLSRLQRDPERYRRTFLKAHEAIVLISFMSVGLMVPLAHPITMVLLGPKWEKASLIFAGFALTALSTPAWSCTWLYTSQGRGRELLKSKSFLSLVMVISFIVGLPFGPLGVALSFSISNCIFRLPILYYLAGRSGPVRTTDLWIGFVRCLPLWPIVFGLTWLTRHQIENLAPLLQLVICVPVGIVSGTAFIFASPRQRQVAMNLVSDLRALPKT